MDWIAGASSRPPPRSRLLELPVELRALILEFTLTSAKPVVAFRLDPFQAESYSEAIPPPVTRVSRLIRLEALSIWYETNAIILHSEGSKCDHAKRWLKTFESHLPRLRRLELWIRYVTLVPHRTPSQGILSIPISRHPGQDHGKWKVTDQGWKWETVVRKPRDAEGDAQFLISTLRRLLVNENTTYLGSHGLWELLVDLRMWYVKGKLDR